MVLYGWTPEAFPGAVRGSACGLASFWGRLASIVAPLVAALVFFGFYPIPLMDTADPYVGDLLSHVGVTDDPPEVTAPAAAGTAEEGEY